MNIEYGYEIWLEGNCLREDEGFETEWEAQEEAEMTLEDILHDDSQTTSYADDGYTADDFEIRIV